MLDLIIKEIESSHLQRRPPGVETRSSNLQTRAVVEGKRRKWTSRQTDFPARASNL